MIPLTKNTVVLSPYERSYLSTLLYFDIFQYPLTAEEIHNFSFLKSDQRSKDSLKILEDQGLVFKINNFYSLHSDPYFANRRQKGNDLARESLTKAKKFSRIISAFPFVRAVMLSGSISKGYMDENSDIDYFIITTKGRLWMARIALVLFRRIFLLNSRKYFCTNYFIDEHSLEIEEKNLFTAIEIATLKCMYGKELINRFHRVNDWRVDYLPNSRVYNPLNEVKKYRIKNILEKILSLAVFDRLENFLMNYSIRRWNKKYQNKLDKKDFGIAFQSTPSVSRSHPEFYQKKVLKMHHEKIREFELKNQVSLEL